MFYTADYSILETGAKPQQCLFWQRWDEYYSILETGAKPQPKAAFLIGR